MQEKDELCIIAGCAALAEALADKLRFDAAKPQSYRTVSYTHLDVYKRQEESGSIF